MLWQSTWCSGCQSRCVWRRNHGEDVDNREDERKRQKCRPFLSGEDKSAVGFYSRLGLFSEPYTLFEPFRILDFRSLLSSLTFAAMRETTLCQVATSARPSLPCSLRD